MAVALQPSIRLTLRLLQVPAALGTTVYRWSTRPFADAGAWSEGRLAKWGAIERSCSTPDGDYDIASCDVELDDSDGLFRGLLAAASTRTFTSREAAIELLSEAGRTAGTAWRTLFRGHVSSVQATPGRKVKLKIADCVGSSFSGFDLEKKFPQVLISRREHPNASDKAVGRPYPIIVGEHSDIGAVDENGNAADKGMLPVIDVGDYLLAEDGSDSDAPLAYLTTPTTLTAVGSGTAGTTTYVYGVTAISPYGETLAGTITLATAPNLLNGTDTVTLTWGAVTGAIEYRVYRDGKFLARLNNLETYTDPETTWTDDGSATPTGIAPPATTTAQIDQVLDSGETAFGWGRLILKIGAAAEVQHVYASDLAEGQAPKRARVGSDLYGSEFLVYGRSGWPHADPWITINGIRMGVLYARGPRLKHHRDGVVTIAWNGCGDDDVGDGTGDTIDDAFPALQHVANEYWLKNAGTGYLTGDFGPLETWSNSVPKLKTSAFASCQTLTATWIGGTGYKAAFALTEQLSGREFIRKFCVTFACHLAANHHGQVYPVLIDDTGSSATGRHYRDRIEIAALESQEIEHDSVETKVRYHYDWDTDAGKFRVQDLILEDEAASDGYGAPRERSVRQCFYTRDAATAGDSNARHLTRFKAPPRYVSIRTDFTGLEDENGAQIRITHYDGAGGSTGDVATPFLVYAHRTSPQAPESVTLTGLDLGRILTTGVPLLAGDPNGFALGDETSSSPPTVGAYELR